MKKYSIAAGVSILLVAGILITGFWVNFHKSHRNVIPKKIQITKNGPDAVPGKVNGPIRKLTILALKKEKRLELWGQRESNWFYIRSYPILAASGKAGPKTGEYDFQVPEGVYKITDINYNSEYHIALHLNYPNEYDREKAKLDNRTLLGGGIYIHGKAQSAGCIAIGDAAIEELCRRVEKVGLANILVIIVPNDLRLEQAVNEGQMHITWVPELYAILKNRVMAYVNLNSKPPLVMAKEKPAQGSSITAKSTDTSNKLMAKAPVAAKKETPKVPAAVEKEKPAAITVVTKPPAVREKQDTDGLVTDFAILAFKKEKVVELWCKNAKGWSLISSYPILSLTGKAGPKTGNWDLEVPEGIYAVVNRGSYGILLNYPNTYDREKAKLDKRTNLGGNIYIFGSAKARGCFSVGDKVLAEINKWISQVGTGKVKVIIAPNDLRIGEPVDEGQININWVPELYNLLKQELTQFTVTKQS